MLLTHPHSPASATTSIYRRRTADVHAHLKVTAANSFIRPDASWPDGNLLSVARGELAPLDRARARELVREIAGYLLDHVAREPEKPRPTLPAYRVEIPTVGKLRWKHEADLERLRENGYQPVRFRGVSRSLP